MIKKMKYALSAKAGLLSCLIIRIYSRTFRMIVENEEDWMTFLKGGGKVLFCAWHQQFFSAIGHFKCYESFKPSLMISKSQDGDIIARIAERQGWHAVRGSSSRDGSPALKEMIGRLNGTGLAAHIVDGPRGPAGIVKAGAITLARATGAAVVPFYTSADRAWYFNSWDRFMLPKPFSRVTISFGPMIHFPSDNQAGTFEDQRKNLEAIMAPALLKP